jgi:hypothetical protein
MSKIKVDVKVDKRAERKLLKALKGLPLELRGKPIIAAQKAAVKPAAQKAYTLAKNDLNTTSLTTRSVQTITGKYVKKTRPYVVVQFKDKGVKARRERESYSSTTTTNWFKISHLVMQGTKRGLRMAGRRTRAAQAGRKRVKITDSAGNSSYTQLSATSGRFFLVQGPKGLHPIKKIQHPGSGAGRYFDRAMVSTKAQMRANFAGTISDKIEQYKRKKGLR